MSGLVDSDPEVQVVDLVPLDIVLVAERTAHHDAGTRLHVDALVGDDRHLVAEQRDLGGLTDEVLVLVVVGVDEDGNARGEKFGARRRDDELLGAVIGCVASDHGEGDIVEVAGLLVVLGLDLRDGGLALGTPDRGRLLAVLATLIVQVEERQLGDALDARLDRLVSVVPVD